MILLKFLEVQYRACILCTALLFCKSINAQKIDFEMGKDDLSHDYVLRNNFFAFDSSENYLNIIQVKKKIIYDKFDKELNRVFSKTFNLKDIIGKEKGEFKLIHVNFIEDRIQLYFTQYKAGKGFLRLYLFGIDLEGKNVIQRHIVDEVWVKDFKDINYRIHYKREFKMNLITYDIEKDKNDSFQWQKVKLMDSNDVVVWDKKIKMPHKDDFYHKQYIDVDKKGNFILFGYTNEKIGKKAHYATKYSVYSYAPADSEGTKIDIGTPGIFMKDLFGYIDSGGTLSIVGKYGNIIEREKDVDDELKGIVYIKYDINNQKFTSLKYNETKIESTNLRQKNMIYYFSRGKLFNDGSSIFVLEGQRVVIGNYSLLFERGDIEILKFNAEGKLIWRQEINKLQQQQNQDRFIGFELFFRNNKTYVLYNANSRSEKSALFDPYSSEQKTIYLSEIAENGFMKTRELSSTGFNIALMTNVNYEGNKDLLRLIITEPFTNIKFYETRFAKVRMKKYFD